MLFSCRMLLDEKPALIIEQQIVIEMRLAQRNIDSQRSGASKHFSSMGQTGLKRSSLYIMSPKQAVTKENWRDHSPSRSRTAYECKITTFDALRSPLHSSTEKGRKLVGILLLQGVKITCILHSNNISLFNAHCKRQRLSQETFTNSEFHRKDQNGFNNDKNDRNTYRHTRHFGYEIKPLHQRRHDHLQFHHRQIPPYTRPAQHIR